MFKKTTFYGLGVATFLAIACFSHWGELKFPSDSLRADVAAVDSVPESVSFLTDYQQATQRAARENKPALLFFMTKNCKFSAQMLQGAFLDPDVERLSKEFVCVAIDANDPQNEDVCEEFNVSNTPTVQFVTSRVVPLQRLTGAKSGEQLAAQMQAALTSVAWRASHAEDQGVLFR